MTKAPERIWAFLDGPFVGMFVSGGIKDGGTEYLRADLALALVAAAYDAAGDVMDAEAAWASDNCYDDARVEYEGYAKTIRALTPDDATAALKTRDQRIRNEALREAAAEASYLANDENKYRPQMSEVTSAILALITEGQSDGE